MVDLCIRLASLTPEALRMAAELGIHNLELEDSFDGKPLARLNGEETEKLRDLLIDDHMKIVLLTTDTDPEDMEGLKLLFRQCVRLNIGAVRMDLDPEKDSNLAKKIAAASGVSLVVENRAAGPLRDEKALQAAVERFGAGIVFDPYEIVCTERHPFLNAFTAGKIKNDIAFLRINDGLYRTHERVPLSHGCAEVKELISILLCRSFKGYFAFSPYLPGVPEKEQLEQTIAQFCRLLKTC